jgi:hypothetical protein
MGYGVQGLSFSGSRVLAFGAYRFGALGVHGLGSKGLGFRGLGRVCGFRV